MYTIDYINPKKMTLILYKKELEINFIMLGKVMKSYAFTNSKLIILLLFYIYFKCNQHMVFMYK